MVLSLPFCTQCRAIPEYYDIVCRKIEAAKDAAEKFEEVSAGWGNASVDIGVNRRKGNNHLDKRVERIAMH